MNVRRLIFVLTIVALVVIVAGCTLAPAPTATPAPTQCQKPTNEFGVSADWFRWQSGKAMIFKTPSLVFTFSRTDLNIRLDTNVLDPRLEKPKPVTDTLEARQEYNVQLSSESMANVLYISIYACSADEVYIFGVDWPSGQVLTPKTN